MKQGYSCLLIALAIFFILSGIYAQQPVGLTKNAREVSINDWEVISDGNNDGSRGGSIFIDNYPYIQIDKKHSYWVAGYLKMNKAYDYNEPQDLKYDPNTKCSYSPWYPLWPYRDNSAKNRSAYFSTFFQLYHSDIGGYMRNLEPGGGARYHKIFFTRIVDSGTTQLHAVSPEFDGVSWSFDGGDEIKFVMAFVEDSDDIVDSSIPLAYRSGSFIYFAVKNGSLPWVRQDPDPINNICYNGDFTTKLDDVSRVYIGATSHGNTQNWEPSISLWESRHNSGEIDCSDGYVPHNMNPLLGNIKRMIIVQGVLDVNYVNDFFADPLGFNPPSSELKLDFPQIVIEHGDYSLTVPFSHWEEYSGSNTGYIRQDGTVTNIPNTNGARSFLRAKYNGPDNSNPSSILNYGITYDLSLRHNTSDREKFKSVAFYIRDWKWPHDYPIFKFYIGATLQKSSDPSNTIQVYFDYTSFNTTNGWINVNGKWYLQNKLIPPSPTNYWYHYNLSLEALLANYPHPGGYNQIKSLDRISIRGRFDIAGLVLNNSPTSSPKIKVGKDMIDRNSTHLISTIAYPNPFNPITNIFYRLPTDSYVELTVYDIHGQKVAKLVDGNHVAGDHTIIWNGKNESGQQVTSGVYFYRIKAGGMVKTQKLLLTR